MNLASLKSKLLPFLDTAKEYGEKAKVYGGKALDFTQRQIQGTPIFLKDEESYNIHASARRAIVIGYDEESSLSQEVILRAPVWAAKAWTDAAEIRYISLTKSPELARIIKMTGPIEMRVSFEGQETFRTNDLTEMRQWWENRIYKKDDKGEVSEAPVTSPQEAPKEADPLSGK